MREEMHAGARLFNAGEYWEAHEAWEVPWNAAKARGDAVEVDYVQGLILLAAAIHKRRHYDSPRGGRLNLHKALRRLERVPAHHDGLDLARHRREVEAALEDPSARPQLPLGLTS
jgi:predicted metal-dependent hydrolase